jgi:glycosyltransferase involved in cell wall biosynthesis
VKLDIPDVSLHVVSVYPEHFANWHNPPLIVCHSPVSDEELLGLYDRASVLLFPLQAGRYSQHAKVLNALARGCPVIMNSNANWSGSFVVNVEVLAADTASDFAHCVKDVLHNPALAMRLANNGCDKMRNEYGDSDGIIRSLQAVYSIALSGSTPKG